MGSRTMMILQDCSAFTAYINANRRYGVHVVGVGDGQDSLSCNTKCLFRFTGS